MQHYKRSENKQATKAMAEIYSLHYSIVYLCLIEYRLH